MSDTNTASLPRQDIRKEHRYYFSGKSFQQSVMVIGFDDLVERIEQVNAANPAAVFSVAHVTGEGVTIERLERRPTGATWRSNLRLLGYDTPLVLDPSQPFPCGEEVPMPDDDDSDSEPVEPHTDGYVVILMPVGYSCHRFTTGQPYNPSDFDPIISGWAPS